MLPLVKSPALLTPIIALNLWTFFMEAWMYATRIPAVSKYNIPVHPNASKDEFNAKIPPHIRWKADNYNHLMEQPTQFYAIAVVLALLGVDGGIDVGLAWLYVAIRVVHSLVHASVNNIMVRFQLFVLSSVVLLVLTARAALLVL